MPVEILKEILKKFPKTKIYNYYGQTELAPYHTRLMRKCPEQTGLRRHGRPEHGKPAEK